MLQRFVRRRAQPPLSDQALPLLLYEAMVIVPEHPRLQDGARMITEAIQNRTTAGTLLQARQHGGAKEPPRRNRVGCLRDDEA